VGLEALSPGQKGPVAATWFTGKLKVTQGKILKPAVPPPIYEKDLMITVEKAGWSARKSLTLLEELAHRDNNHLETGSLREVRKRARGAPACHYQNLAINNDIYLITENFTPPPPCGKR